MPVSVVTDSTHYLPAELVQRHGISEVSLYVAIDGEQQREADMDLSAFYAHLRSGGSLPTTSQPSIGDFLEIYGPLVEQGHDIVSVHLSGGISGTVESARQAAAELMTRNGNRRIEIVDSNMAAAGLAVVVLAAAHAARLGGDVDAVADHARRATASGKIWFVLDTLEYVRRGGRIGGAQAWIGGALRVKPILSIEGTVAPVERVRTSSRAFDRLLDYLRARADDGCTAWAVQHIENPEQAERFVDAGRAIMGREPLFTSTIGPVIGTYAGPGLLGFAALAPEFVAPPES